MRQRVQQRSENLLTTFIVTAKRAKGGMIALVFFILNLVCRVGANFPCKPQQIHWNSTEGRRYKCLDCPDCPEGSQPSVACGTSVKYGTPVHCVPCELGKTYSDKYDKAQCKSCTICSQGKAVKTNCTFSMNTKCDHKCGHGFYTVDLISSCLPCTQCCDDGKDELAMECMNNKKKCKVRYSTCTQVHTTPWKPPDRSYNSSSTLSTTQTLPLESDTTTTQVNKEEKAVSDQLITSVTPDLSVENEALKGEAVQPGKQDGTSIVVILLTVVLAMCLVLSALVITKKFLPGIGLLRSSREQNRENGGNTITSRQPSSQSRHWSASHKSGQDSVSLLFNRPESSQTNRSESPQSSGCTTVSFNRPESSQSSRPECPKINMSAGSPQPDGCNLPQPSGYTQSQLNRFPSHLPRLTASEQSSQFAQPQDKSNLGDVTLEQLEENNLPVFDWMCKELDISRRRGVRWDFESLAFQYKEISPTIRNSLRNEFQNDRGSPSDVLMSHIKTKYPNLPLRHLIGTLQNIGRSDIAQGLMPYTYMVPKVDNSSTQGQRL